MTADVRKRLVEGDQQPLKVSVQTALERMIVSGELPAGERLNEITLAKRLGVSRGPIREAARALERQGLVTVIMNRGAFVRSLSLTEVAELYDLAAVVIGFACGRAAQFSNPKHGVVLSDYVRKMEQANSESEVDRWFELNESFHSSILAFSQNNAAKAVYEDCMKRMLLLRRRSFELPQNIVQANDEHRQILEAILAGSADRARICGEAHVRSGRSRFLSTISPDTAASPVG